jgi:heme A synthase
MRSLSLFGGVWTSRLGGLECRTWGSCYGHYLHIRRVADLLLGGRLGHVLAAL